MKHEISDVNHIQGRHMSTTDEPPTIGERYSTAIETSNLKFDTQARMPVDIIIAAGCSDAIGARLVRLRAEFDAVHSEHAAAEAQLRSAEGAARKVASEKAHDAAARSKEMMARAEREAVTARALILIRLKSLTETKGELGRIAVIEATKQRFMKSDGVVLALVGRCLDVFLDPNCPACEGRGFNGGGRHEHTGPQILCRPCSGAGHRRGEIGHDAEERRFAAYLLALMERRASEAEAEMGRRLRTHEA